MYNHHRTRHKCGKGFAFDLNGNVIGSQRGYYPTFHTEPDYSEQDPDQMFITMLYV